MCKTISSFDQLKSFYKTIERVDNSVFGVLANSGAKDSARKKAMKELELKVEVILNKIDSDCYLLGEDDRSVYVDYCRNLAAYALVCTCNTKVKQLLLSMEVLLEYLAPLFKKELRAFKKSLRIDNSIVEKLMYNWEDINNAFLIDRFVEKFIVATVSIPEQPKVIVEEKIVEVEKVVEKVVERVVEKTVFVEVELQDDVDMDYFGVEDHHTEFKSSFFYAPIGQEIQDQRIEVCRKVCGFLNADGGKIYIGVDDTTGKAFPMMLNGSYVGIWGDIMNHPLFNNYGASILDVQGYVKYIKDTIKRFFEQSNKGVDLSFINECIHVDRTSHDNVVCIDVKPSKNCTVYLNGIAYQRDGEECKRMTNEQITAHNETRRRIRPEAYFEAQLCQAIKEHRQVKFHRYHSANSNTVEDRRVEPYAFVCDNEAVMCYDLDKKAVRQFKLSRIEDITILNTTWQNEDNHCEKRTDAFDWSFNGSEFHICLDMSVKAMNIFCENYSNSNKELLYKVNNNEWRLDTKVYSLEPVIGFYLSMAKDIIIQDTEDTCLFKKEIKDYVYAHVLN